MESIKRRVHVISEKVIDIEIVPSMFGDMTEEEFIKEFSGYLFPVSSIDDVAEYAAGLVADGFCDCEHDAIGLLNHSDSKYPREGDVKYRVVEESTDTSIVGGDY